MTTKIRSLVAAAVGSLFALINSMFAQGTAFTYQGQLQQNGAPANGTYNLAFTLLNASSGGAPIAGPVTNNSVGVTNGLFLVSIDFGSGVFNGQTNWLQIAVETNGGSSFTALAPRQQLTPAPYAIYASGAGTAAAAGSVAATNISGTILLAQLPPSVLTNDATNVTLAASSLSVSGTNRVAPLTVPPNIPIGAAGSVGTGTSPVSVTVNGRYAYVVNFDANTLQIVDVSIPSALAVVSSVATGAAPYSVAVAGRYAYVANSGANTLQVFDVGNPASPVSVGLASAGNAPASVAVAGRYAYVANFGSGTFQVFDVSNPSMPLSAGSAATGSGPLCVAAAGRYAYVANYSANTLQVFDVSNPSAPLSAGSASTSINPRSVVVAGSYAYVANEGTNTMQIFDVSNPSNPVNAASATVGLNLSCVVVAGRYAYVLDNGINTLQVFDVSNPSAPVNAGSVSTGSDSLCLAVSGRYAYVASFGTGQLQAFDFGGEYAQHLEAGAMETGTLQTRDTVTVGNNLDVRGGLTASGSARISGGLSVDRGTISASNFVGNAAGLTGLNATNITGAIPDAVLSTNVALRTGGNAFTGTQTISGGGLGIGTSPLAPLHVTSTGYPTALMAGSSSYGTWLALINSSTGGTNWSIISTGASNGQGSGKLLFDTASAPGSSSGDVMILAAGGVTVYGTFNNNSDRNAKQDVSEISPAQILDKVARLPVSEWSYKVDAATRHIGPMAQDFHAAFEIGTDDKHIAPIDEGGVALAAIKALNEKLEVRDAEIKQLQRSVADLKAMLSQPARNKER